MTDQEGLQIVFSCERISVAIEQTIPSRPETTHEQSSTTCVTQKCCGHVQDQKHDNYLASCPPASQRKRKVSTMTFSRHTCIFNPSTYGSKAKASELGFPREFHNSKLTYPHQVSKIIILDEPVPSNFYTCTISFWGTVDYALLFLTASKYLTRSSLLGTIHSQTVVILDLHPSTHVLALVSHTRRQPLCKILITL